MPNQVTQRVSLATQAPGATGDGVGGVGNTNLPATTGGPALSDNTTPWEGILVVEGVTTGDGREFAPGSLTWPDAVTTNLPLSWQEASIEGHNGSVVVGRIDQIWRDPVTPTTIRASGVLDLGAAAGQEVFRGLQGGFMGGVSVDVDSVNDADVELVYPVDPESGDEEASDDGDLFLDLFGPPPEKVIFHGGRIRGATLVALPAFVEARIALVDAQPVLTAAAGSQCSNFNRLCPHLRRDGSFDVNLAARQISVLLTQVAAGLSFSQRHAIYSHLATHLRELGLEAQPFSLETLAEDVRVALVADAGAAAVLDVARPPAEWFADPRLNGEPGLVIDPPDASGLQRVRGYAAFFNVGHIGTPRFTTAPREARHDYFMQGSVLTQGGDLVPVGSITLGTGHAATDPRVDVRSVLSHYDNTGTAVADVACGNDAHGIWVAGYVRPGTAAVRVVELRASKLSGDWRHIGGQLRLVALLAVNVPGFPQPRPTARYQYGVQVALVAAGMLPDHGLAAHAAARDAEQLALRQLKARLARQVGRDPASRRAALRARVHQSTGV